MNNYSEARNEIRELMFSYTDALDGGDLNAVAALFEHCTVRVNGLSNTAHGTKQVREFFGSVIFYKNGEQADQDEPESTPATQHLTSNVYIDIGDDFLTAIARSRFTVFQACTGLPLQPIIAGRYHDTFVRHGGRWRFAERVEFIDLVGDLTHHLAGEFIQKTALLSSRYLRLHLL